MDDWSESADGPWLVALQGDESPQNELQLGTRDYEWHQHVRGQMCCVHSGLVQVRTAHGTWLLPPHRAAWIPPGVPHQISVSGAHSGWGVLLSPSACKRLPKTPFVISVSDMMQALVRRAEAWDKSLPLTPEQARVAQVIVDEIRLAPRQSLHLPMPRDARLARLANALAREPGSARTLQDWATWAAMSPRTLQRQIKEETGLTFAQWRIQAQLARALELLASGLPVAHVSDALGYASTSNFIAMFKRALGQSPGKYFGASVPHRRLTVTPLDDLAL